MMPHPFSLLRQITAALIALIAASSALAETAVKPRVSGKFTGNGKNAAIQYILVEEREPFSDKEAITLIFTEKDPSKAKRPAMDAIFGKLGSALVLSAYHDGGLFGCEVSHSAHSERGFTSVGSIKMEDFKFENGNVSGRATTGKEVDTFGEKWEVDLTFSAPLPKNLGKAPKPEPAKTEPEEPAKKELKAAPGPMISARNLPLPKDAANVEYKQTVKHIQFSCARPVEPVAKEFSASLKEQGWKEMPGSLVGKQNAVLRREQGDAKLTIMIQPAPTGSTVKIFTEGLDWSGGDDKTSSKKTVADDISDAEAQAEKLMKEQLKNLPTGF